MSGAWPKVLIDRCEINLPYVGELWSTLTALFIVVAGIVPLCTSKYSDEEIDLVNALIVLNGITSALAHSTLLGIFGAADGLSINIGAALYVKAIVLAHHPQIYNSPVQCVLRHLAYSQHSLSPYSKLCAIPQQPLHMSDSMLDLHAPNLTCAQACYSQSLCGCSSPVHRLMEHVHRRFLSWSDRHVDHHVDAMRCARPFQHAHTRVWKCHMASRKPETHVPAWHGGLHTRSHLLVRRGAGSPALPRDHFITFDLALDIGIRIAIVDGIPQVSPRRLLWLSRRARGSLVVPICCVVRSLSPRREPDDPTFAAAPSQSSNRCP